MSIGTASRVVQPRPTGHLGAGPTGGVRGRRGEHEQLASPPRDARPPACPTPTPAPAATSRSTTRCRAGARTAATTSGWAPGHCSPGWCRTPRTSTCPLAGPTRWAGPTTTTCATPPRRRPAPTSPWSWSAATSATPRRWSSRGSSRSSAGRWGRSPGRASRRPTTPRGTPGCRWCCCPPPAGRACRRAWSRWCRWPRPRPPRPGTPTRACCRSPSCATRRRVACSPRTPTSPTWSGPNPARPSGSPVPAWPRP